MSKTYKIVRFYANPNKRNKVIKTGLTLEEAQKHCENPETSSRTANKAVATKKNDYHGAWFDGYTEE